MLAVKAHQVAPIAPDLRSLFGPDTVVVTLQNGIPWWYFENFNGPHVGYQIKTVDPDGVTAENIQPHAVGEQVVLGQVEQ